MNRTDVIQKVINDINATSYLEIGLGDSSNFRSLKAKVKVGVDPNISIGFKKFTRKILHNEQTFKLTSDQYFSQTQERFDVIFIDGLHTYSQARKDIINALTILNEGGVIIVHDTNPLSAANAFPVENDIDEVLCKVQKGEIPGWNGNWNGDVWKAIYYLRMKRQDLSIQTVDLDFGLSFITKRKAQAEYKIEDVDLDQLTFDDFHRNRERILNLMTPEDFFSTVYN